MNFLQLSSVYLEFMHVLHFLLVGKGLSEIVFEDGCDCQGLIIVDVDYSAIVASDEGASVQMASFWVVSDGF